MPSLPAELLDDQEMALLLACARATPGGKGIEAQRALAGAIDAERFLALAQRHMVVPLVWHNLKYHPRGTFDEGLLDALRSGYRQNVVGELVWTHAALEIHRLLDAAGIAHCFLKGPAVASRHYGETTLRAIGDIDLLVEPASVDKANQLLLMAGYVAPEPLETLTPRQRRYFRYQQNQIAYTHPVSGVGVELHWRADQVPCTLAALDAFSGRGYFDLGGRSLPCLDDEEMLLHLCVHGGKHVWHRLKWVFDLPNALEGRDWDWPSLRRKAEANRCEHALLLGLAVAEQLCGWEAPSAVRGWMGDPRRFSAHFALIGKALASRDRWLNSPAGILERNRYAARFNDGLDCWAYQLATLATHRRDWELIRLPDALFPLYFVLSPFTNLWHFAGRFRSPPAADTASGERA